MKPLNHILTEKCAKHFYLLVYLKTVLYKETVLPLDHSQIEYTTFVLKTFYTFIEFRPSLRKNLNWYASFLPLNM